MTVRIDIYQRQHDTAYCQTPPEYLLVGGVSINEQRVHTAS